MMLPLIAALILVSSHQASPPPPPPALDLAATRARLEYVTEKLRARGWSPTAAWKPFGDRRVRLYPAPTVTGKPIDWNAFEQGLLRTASVNQGKRFLKANSTILNQAEKRYGVDKYSLVALIRIETVFGQNMGNYSAFNVFFTNLLRPDASEAKWQWAGDNLAALLVHARNLDYDPHRVKSSWAGAIGIPQFLPVSILAWGKDGNGDGQVDLHNTKDAIISAANYLAEHGWKEDQARALARYYGSAVGYPQAALKYSQALAK